MKRKTYVRRGAIILAVMMLVSLCGMLPTAALDGRAGGRRAGSGCFAAGSRSAAGSSRQHKAYRGDQRD